MAGIPLADAMPSIEELDAQCKRKSGKSLHEWDEFHSGQRGRALALKNIRPDRPLRHSEVQRYIYQYGFQPDDFTAKQISTAAVRNFEPDFRAVLDGRTGKQAETVIRWFIKPDRLPS